MVLRLKVIAIGVKMPEWVYQGCSEYSKRLPREFNFEMVELPLGHRGKSSDIATAMRAEGQAMLKAVDAADRVIALDVEGVPWSTPQLAKRLGDWQLSGDNYSLLIGGPDGLAPECVERADLRWSLSPLTLPHPLVRVLLVEQLYRAWSINVNHPYHRS